MTSLQIQYFLKTADCMSFSQAAKELFVSQPSVSRQIKLLEDELGFRLFDRTRRNRIDLTPAGMIFRETFRTSAQSLARARMAAQDVSGLPVLRLRVGIGEMWDMTDELIAFREQAHEHYPHAELHFESHPFQTLRDKLRADALDVIVCLRTSLPDFDDLELLQIANLEPRAYVRRGLLRPADEPLRIEDFDGQPLLMLDAGESPMAMELGQMNFVTKQVQVHPVWMPNRESILQAVLLGEGVTVLDQRMRFRGDPRLTWISLDDRIPLCIAWLRRNQNPLIRLFADVFSKQDFSV